MGIDSGTQEIARMELLETYRAKMKRMKPIPPRIVTSGPIFENQIKDEAVDLLREIIGRP